MNQRIWGWASIVTGIFALLMLYGSVLKNPDSFMFGAYGDSVKNYFTFAWHVRYDSNWLNFSGSNYPYGDHVCYTDGHPIFSLVLRHFNWARAYPIGTLNILMLLSQILGIASVYLLLKEMGVRRYIAALGGLSMVWLQPNMFRMLGHFSLSHVWVIPIGLFLVLRYWKSARFIWAVALAVYCVFLFFLHPYYGMMVSLIPLCVGFFDLVLNGISRKMQLRSALYICAGIIAPAFYLVFLKLTDTHTPRPDKALGFLIHTSSIDDILVSALPPFKHFMSQIIKVERQNWEGSAYIGIATMAILLVYTGIRTFNYKQFKFNPDSLFLRLLLAGLAILLFSFGFPFKNGFEHWLTYLPFIEQFRAPGRFAWVFYFIMVSSAFVILNKWCSKLHDSGKVKLAYSLPLVAFALYFSEGYIGQTGMAQKAQQNRNTLTTKPSQEIREQLNQMGGRKFSAIIPIPFFHYGTDYLFLTSNYDEQKLAYELAYHSGIPLMASSNPRASIQETGKTLNFFSPPFVFKPDIKSSDSFWVYNQVENKHLQHNYYLPKISSEISIKEEQAVYAQLNNAINSLDTSSIRNILSEYYSTNFFITPKLTNDNTLKSNAKAKQIVEIATYRNSDFIPQKMYEASVMLYAHDIHKISVDFLLEKIGAGVEIIHQVPLNETFHYYGDSALCTLTFIAPDSAGVYIFTLKGTRDNKLNYAYNHFLLREKNELAIEIDTAANSRRIIRINNFKVQ
jgi:hypothetical protein